MQHSRVTQANESGHVESRILIVDKFGARGGEKLLRAILSPKLLRAHPNRTTDLRSKCGARGGRASVSVC